MSVLTVMPGTHRRTDLLAIALMLGAAACFPTFQAARVEPGLRLDAAVTVLADQPRHNTTQGTDIIGFLTPAYGFGP